PDTPPNTSPLPPTPPTRPSLRRRPARLPVGPRLDPPAHGIGPVPQSTAHSPRAIPECPSSAHTPSPQNSTASSVHKPSQKGHASRAPRSFPHSAPNNSSRAQTARL